MALRGSLGVCLEEITRNMVYNRPTTSIPNSNNSYTNMGTDDDSRDPFKELFIMFPHGRSRGHLLSAMWGR